MLQIECHLHVTLKSWDEASSYARLGAYEQVKVVNNICPKCMMLIKGVRRVCACIEL